ncbi:MAG: bifunctional hydroxymethylpyrimidine kinase/phosphomethylpyrimidine kinase [Verrucomicrobia bacterium]|nr:bifunctional hydroxymethylpyrimidine kinase/phosphomethylpyrimidine kinase [Verrucomicrobiota bacterium]
MVTALTIAGSDSGGGAGIQADLHTFNALGVHGTSAITCLTAQNPDGVFDINSVKTAMVREQIKAVFDAFSPAAVKTGMLYSARIVKLVAELFRDEYKTRLVVDPVMAASSGALLLRPDAVRAIKRELLPPAALVTPNLYEAEILVNERISGLEDMRRAAREIKRLYGCAALVKGGHLSGCREAVDFFNDGEVELLLKAPFYGKDSPHGTGCTYSSAITAYLAQGLEMPASVQKAKEYITGVIERSMTVGGYKVLNWLRRTGRK